MAEKIKKVKRWIAFFVLDGEYILNGSGMTPKFYQTKEDALETNDDYPIGRIVVPVMVEEKYIKNL